jgi:hypothetical protein
MRLLIVLTLIAVPVGCSSEVQLKGAPVSVSGKVSQSGRPVGGVMLIFHPLGDGQFREFPVRKDGTFEGELISGDYAYYVAKSTVVGAAQTPSKLSHEYFVADLTRTVSVEPGKQLAIALD